MTTKFAIDLSKDFKQAKIPTTQDLNIDNRTTPSTIEKASIEWQKESIIGVENLRKLNSSYPVVGEAINSIFQFQMEITRVLLDIFGEINVLR